MGALRLLGEDRIQATGKGGVEWRGPSVRQVLYSLDGGVTLGALTKAQMADRLFEELGLNKREAKEIVEMFFDEVRSSLERNEQVKLSGFGNFDLREKGERPGRNPKTGEEIPISARRVVTFRPGQKLKARVEAYAGRESE